MQTSLVCADQRWHLQATGVMMRKKRLIVLLAFVEIVALTVMMWVVLK
jgi:hypothetical protein